VIDWDGIEHILKRPNYWYLQRFVVAGLSKPVLDATKTWMQNRLPTLSERIVVEIQ
jgi:hypothetical protein